MEGDRDLQALRERRPAEFRGNSAASTVPVGVIVVATSCFASTCIAWRGVRDPRHAVPNGRRAVQQNCSFASLSATWDQVCARLRYRPSWAIDTCVWRAHNPLAPAAVREVSRYSGGCNRVALGTDGIL